MSPSAEEKTAPGCRQTVPVEDALKPLREAFEAVGVARQRGEEAIERATRDLEQVIREMRSVMFLCGANDVEEMRGAGYVVHGRTRDWLAEGVE